MLLVEAMKEGNPVLTAILPCYNFEKYVEECIDSIIAQTTRFGIKIYVIDDCSTDNTFKIINDKYGSVSNISIFQSHKNQGVTKNIRDMLEKVDTPYVFLLDGDDYLVDKDYLQRAVDFLDSNPEFSLYFTGYKRIYNGVSIKSRARRSRMSSAAVYLPIEHNTARSAVIYISSRPGVVTVSARRIELLCIKSCS